MLSPLGWSCKLSCQILHTFLPDHVHSLASSYNFSCLIPNILLHNSRVSGFRPEGCISTIYPAWDTLFWSGTLDILSHHLVWSVAWSCAFSNLILYILLHIYLVISVAWSYTFCCLILHILSHNNPVCSCASFYSNLTSSQQADYRVTPQFTSLRLQYG